MNILTTTSSFSLDDFPASLTVIHNPYKRRLTEEEVISLIEQYQPVGIIAGVEPLTRKVLEKAKNLKIISRCGIGLDSVDLEAAREFGIKVANTPDAPTASVAEFTLGLMLCILRRIHTLDALIRNGGWKGPQGNLLKDKTVGVIGCGRIGTYVAKLVKAFGCNMLGYDPFIKNHDICKMVSFDELISHSDIITLHMPYTEENRHMIGKEELSKMKKTAFLINTARGGLVDEDALYDALKSGQIAGAALDCFENEPYDGPLKTLDNVVLAAHMGASAVEGRAIMERQALDNLVNELKAQGLI
ncbi:MAG TPA: phosphoglycerate dehydrogenase [Clostridiaceae bacterium]|nr:phosphoglycerate dehydrogenase [Clostridiaceae bacterium]